MRPILPSNLPGLGQPQKSLIDERRRLQRVPVAFAAHVAPRQAPELCFHERNELFEGRVVTVAPGS
jgi:hypothetical protein